MKVLCITGCHRRKVVVDATGVMNDIEPIGLV